QGARRMSMGGGYLARQQILDGASQGMGRRRAGRIQQTKGAANVLVPSPDASMDAQLGQHALDGRPFPQVRLNTGVGLPALRLQGRLGPGDSEMPASSLRRERLEIIRLVADLGS